MGWRRKVPAETKLARRLARMETTDFPKWVEQCLLGVGRGMVDYSRDSDPIHIEEALSAAQVAVEVLTEFKRRVTLD